MSTTSKYEPVARQGFGPTTTSENVYELLDHKLTDMNVPSIRTPVLRALPVSPGDQEPDSTNPESTIQSTHLLDKEVEYHIAEKRCDSDMAVDSLSGIVRIEENTLDNVGRIAYPIHQETDDSNDGHYDNSNATLIQGPLNTAIVQNVTKLPQNFTINVDAAVGNITAIQNVSQDVSSNQTLWLPTILATSATPDSKGDDDRSQAGLSQIIITSESFVNEASQLPQANLVADTNYLGRSKSSKVQILSNISIPKNTNYSQQYISQGKEVTTPVYGTQNHIYKLSSNVMPQKHLNNSVLCTKPPKSQSLIGCSSLPSVINSSPIKNISYSHTFTKSTNLNKTLNKVNNGANLNALVAASTGNTQCHILSRVVSGPNKMSVHSGRKSVNTFKGKNSHVPGSQKNQSRAIKIIQQAGSSSHKSDGKPWSMTNVKGQCSQSYGVMEAKSSKIIQKVGSPNHKAQPQQLPKPPAGERLILQSPCGPVLISTAPISTSLSKGPHYVQSGSTPNLRYVQTYGSENQLSAVSQVSANQQLTAQILQSLSQPKLMLHPNTTPIGQTLPLLMNDEEPLETKLVNQKRIVFGDKSTLLTADDILGMEERPNITEELRRYSFTSLAFAMLDHTYALPSQKHQAPVTPPAPVPPPPPMPAVISSPQPIVPSSPLSPLKRCSPVIMSTASYDLPLTVPTSSIGTPIPVSTVPTAGMSYKSGPLPADEDTASVISSLDGDRKNRGGSDTETAPEMEEEGKTRCICDFTHDDGYMICCDRCGEWQHVDCMGVDRNNIPDSYMCEVCQPRPVDRRHARAIQLRKREELNALGASDSDSSEITRLPGQRRKRLLTVTTYTNTSGSCVTTYNSAAPVLPPLPQPSLTLPKRGPKRPKKTEVLRKGTKRKLTEKRVKRKKEMMLNRSKYGSSLTNQSHWQDSYELAMTNHYSPELRAKIMKYSSKLGNTPNMASAITAHLCTTVPHAGGKILIATKDLKDNVPIIELRGKYMLSTQHRPQLQNSARAGSQKPGPFVFFYKLPRDSIQICIDTRTYGNEARFVRRSCKPNAELQHCIVKGALHVYLVTMGTVQSDTEITVGHDSNGGKQPCACGNPKHCKVNGLNPLLSRKSIEYPTREKRSRNRLSSSSSPVSPPPVLTPLTPIKEQPPLITPIKSEKKSPIKHEYYPISPSKSVVTALQFDEPIKAEAEPKAEEVEEKPEFDLTTKEEMKPEIDEPDYPRFEPKEPEIAPPEDEPDDIEPEEPAPIEPKPEVPVPVEEKVEEHMKSPKKEREVKSEKEPLFSDEEKVEKLPKFERKMKEELLVKEDRIMTRELAAKSACHDRSSRSSRTNPTCVNQDSMDDKTDDSQDKLPTKSNNKDKKKMTREERKMEAIMKAFERMEKAEQRKQEVKERQKRRESDPHPNSTEKDDEDCIPGSTKKRKKRKGRARTTSQCNRRRLNSVDSEAATSGDEAPPNPIHADDSANHAPSEEIGLSSACLLVEAAVGSVESAFKLPKTKKTMANEWAGRSPERTPSPYRSPYAGSLAAGSLESLVRVASSIIGDLSADHEPRALSHQHSAKKRWLRQAISEESDSPTAESPPNEMVTPLKKRRLARESLSCEQNSVVPCNDETSPNLTSEDSPVKDDPSTVLRQYKVRNIMDSIYGRDRTRSDSGQGSDDQCNIDNDVLNVDIKGAHDSANIRRIIGVPTPEDEVPPELPGREYKTNNNNVDLDETKVVPMEIDTAITHPKIEENIQSLQTEPKSIESLDDKVNSSQSADTSGNSSPQRDEMDDIQKKIHSFHTENILMLKSRNKKPPKEKRKKVNLNFDLNMVDDQISVQLRTERNLSNELQDDGVHENAKIYVCPENIPLPPTDASLIENIPLPDDSSPTPLESIPLPSSPPSTDKRKKVNLNFDLNMVDDQISVQLRKDRSNGNLHDDTLIHENAKIHVSPEYIPLPEEPSPRHKRRTNVPTVNGDLEDTRIHLSPVDIPFPPEDHHSPVQQHEEPPIEKRKKVNLNFDLSMVNDQISVELRTEKEVNGEKDPDWVHDNAKIHVSPEYIPIPPVESAEQIDSESESVTQHVDSVIRPVESVMRPVETTRPAELLTSPAESNISIVESTLRPVESLTRPVESIIRPEPVVRALEPINAEPIMRPSESVVRLADSSVRPVDSILKTVESVVRSVELEYAAESKEEETDQVSVTQPLEPAVPFSSRFSSTGLFSGIFGGVSQFNLEQPSDENVPNMSIIKSAIDRTTLESGIFDKDSRTQMDELRSVQEILTRVNNMDSNNSVLLSGVLKNSNKPAALLAPTRPAAKPYCVRTNDPRLNPPPTDKPKPVRRKLSISEYRKRQQGGAGGCSAGGEEGSGSPGSPPSPPRSDCDDLDQRLQRDLAQSYVPKGIFDAQPTASERQRENLSSRLRREFGLALPEDEESRHAPTPGTASLHDTRLQTLDLDKLTAGQMLDCIGVNALDARDVSLGVTVNKDGSVSGYTTVTGSRCFEASLKSTEGEQGPKFKLETELSALNKQREDLSSRLKREFGLALNEDESSRLSESDASNVPEKSQDVGYTTVEFTQKQTLNQNLWQTPDVSMNNMSPGSVRPPQVNSGGARYQRFRPYGTGRGRAWTRGRGPWRHRGGYTM